MIRNADLAFFFFPHLGIVDPGKKKKKKGKGKSNQ